MVENMQINIKNAQTHALAAQLAAITGESMTQAITVALQERLAHVKTSTSNDTHRLLAIGQACAVRLRNSPAMQSAEEFLYDDRGLPK
jgi:antitoxin VapB